MNPRNFQLDSSIFLRKAGYLCVSFFTLFALYHLLSSPGSCGPEDARASGRRISVGIDVHADEVRRRQAIYNISEHRTLIHHSGLELYLHAAFLDDRFSEAIIRIFGLQKKDEIQQDYVCRWDRIEYDAPVSTEVAANRVLIDPSWPQWSPYYAVTFDCHFPAGSNPKSVRLASRDKVHVFHIKVEKTLRVPPKKRKTLAVCVKPVTGQFKVARLVEWFEILQLVGVRDFLIYTTDVIGSARFVIDYYRSLGVARTMPFPYLMSILQHVDDPPMPSGQERYAVYQQTYLVAMHDCLYRFRGLYENLLFIDVDEVLLPTQTDKTLIQVIREVRQQYIHGAGYLFKTAWHFEENQARVNSSLPVYMYMHRHAMASVPTDNQPKSIIVTDRAISLNFHSILDVPSKEYSNEALPWESTAYIHHFRGRCDVKFEDWRCRDLFSKYKQDPVLPRYKDYLQLRLGKVIDQLQLH